MTMDDVTKTGPAADPAYQPNVDGPEPEVEAAPAEEAPVEEAPVEEVADEDTAPEAPVEEEAA